MHCINFWMFEHRLCWIWLFESFPLSAVGKIFSIALNISLQYSIFKFTILLYSRVLRMCHLNSLFVMNGFSFFLKYFFVCNFFFSFRFYDNTNQCHSNYYHFHDFIVWFKLLSNNVTTVSTMNLTIVNVNTVEREMTRNKHTQKNEAKEMQKKEENDNQMETKMKENDGTKKKFIVNILRPTKQSFYCHVMLTQHLETNVKQNDVSLSNNREPIMFRLLPKSGEWRNKKKQNVPYLSWSVLSFFLYFSHNIFGLVTSFSLFSIFESDNLKPKINSPRKCTSPVTNSIFVRSNMIVIVNIFTNDTHS